ncbi:MAG: uncharacterized protein JWN03_9018 [Nocardia sp.]|uniref:serpin family protein n=1 Tax=Nocardia sp. TaxID=1821 RepID=UPI0026283251|nr:serpin family protein [Nocardia sp.]MCU1648743.1 uncharacterized protein [Nocardia sp.]
MPIELSPHVSAANRLTARWCAVAGEDDFVLSGCGVWPLLALLAATADEPARSELAAAAGVSPESAHADALHMLATLGTAESVSAALGVWVNRNVKLRGEWLRSLPVGTADLLGDQAELDAWADRHTGGLIDRFPLEISPDTLLVLATALVAKTQWQDTFRESSMSVSAGPWRGHTGPALARYTRGREDAGILDGPSPVTRVVVRGTADLDVHLLLGDGSAADVLGAGLIALNGGVTVRSELPAGTEGPGLTVQAITSTVRGDSLQVSLPPFNIQSSHDLCEQPALFGLTAAMDSEHGHFPGISDTELAIGQAGENVRAKFTATGFEAAAVTAFGLIAGSMPPRDLFTTAQTTVTFDRPFGFLAVHRTTGAAVVAGWVAQPVRDN